MKWWIITQEGSWVPLYARKICCSNPRASLCFFPCQPAAELQTRHRTQGVPASWLCLRESHSHTLQQQPAAGRDAVAAVYSSTGAALAHSGRSPVNLRDPSSSWNAIGTAKPIFRWFTLWLSYTNYFKAFFPTGKSSSSLLKQGRPQPLNPTLSIGKYENWGTLSSLSLYNWRLFSSR